MFEEVNYNEYFITADFSNKDEETIAKLDEYGFSISEDKTYATLISTSDSEANDALQFLQDEFGLTDDEVQPDVELDGGDVIMHRVDVVLPNKLEGKKTFLRPGEFSRRVLIGHCGVDSGQLMISDPSYVRDFEDNNKSGDTWEPEKYTGQYNYQGACGLTLTNPEKAGMMNFKNGVSGAGVVFSTGFGDGAYDVYATITDCGPWGERVSKVEVELISDKEVREHRNTKVSE